MVLREKLGIGCRHPCELAALFFSLLSEAQRLPNIYLIPLAIRLAKGIHVPIAPLILGNLCAMLDQTYFDFKRSLGDMMLVFICPLSLYLCVLREKIIVIFFLPPFLSTIY